MSQVKRSIYTKDNIDELPWPESDWSRESHQVLKSFVKFGPDRYISNVQATMKALLIDDLVLPITVCEPSRENSYVCSPYCHYVTYGREEIKRMKRKRVKRILESLIDLLGKLLDVCYIDKNVFVNNWLLPTNLHPSLSKEQLEAITETLTTRYPDHAVVFRSVNTKHPQGLYDNLKNLGYSFVLSREIYHTDTSEEAAFKSRMFKSDQKILLKSGYTATTDSEKLLKAIPRIKDLYYALNINKYSPCNPQYTEEFIRLGLDSRWMTYKAFEKDGNIDAVFGYYSNGSEMTSPYFGYDLSLPSHSGLYRKISAQLLLDAKEKKMLLHQSSGAGHYKKLRRAKESMEYTAVYYKHLPLKRRLGWSALERLMNSFGKKFMRG